ncbi:MAG TPA: SIR2 family protein [Thermoanaerobaculia bacterium]|jgi:hypothetical protein|nr:SIR2 family protein [Thermoanaerobaculia bacterium]
MFFGKIDFPEMVRDAALAGELVVFAGAGVSSGEPANLPSFKKLCLQIGMGLAAELQKEEEEPEDEYLGRLIDAGVPVHERAARELNLKDTDPTELHHSLVKLFSSPEHCRIATTNFDLLFEKAAKKRWVDCPFERFAAPALPRGEDFTGIVHVHGDLSSPEKRMVLSDADFARAYLTEGWARRFLRGVAERFVVLFVGFSFQDVPSRYLIRGLPVAKRLFALIPSNEAPRVPRNITSVPFDPVSEFVELQVGLREFAVFVGSDEAQHRERIAQLAEGLPPPDGQQADYMKWASLDKVQAIHLGGDPSFARQDWLMWASERNLLALLFADASGEHDPAAQAIAQWFWRLALRDDIWRECAEIVAAHHGRIAPRVRQVLWWVLADRVKGLKREGLPLGPREEYWTAIAASCGGAWPRATALPYLLSDLPQGEAETFIELWSAAGRPELVISPTIRHAGADSERAGIRFELGFGPDFYMFREAWSWWRENAEQIAPVFLPVVRSQLEAAHRLRRMIGEVSVGWDPDSFARTEISDSAENIGLDVLIEAARDSLLALAKSKSKAFAREFEGWITSAAPLVQRIALFAAAGSSYLTPEKALRRLSNDSWFDIPSARPEVFALLRVKFPAASPVARKRFLDAMAPRPLSEVDEPDDSRRRDRNRSLEYGWFNLLTWLNEGFPGDAELALRLREVRERRPGFEKHERLDLEYWHYELSALRARTFRCAGACEA